MQKISSLLSLCLIGFSLTAFSQDDFPDFGKFSDAEKKLKDCSFDKDAEAIVLLDEAISTHDPEYHLITRRRIRIKILNEIGLDHATIIIPFYTKDNFEKIIDIQGLTYNYNGENQADEYRTIAKKDIFTEVVNDRVSNIRFTMPSAKAGSIIEYSYTSEMKHYGGLQDWVFQDEIPTLKSAYLLTLLPNTEFSYLVFKKEDYNITITPKESSGQVYFEMINIPGLKFEPFMNAPNDYLQKVQFQLSSYKSMYGTTVNVNDTWQKLAKDLSDDISLGNALKRDLPGIDELRTIIASETNQKERLIKIYEYVQSNFTWNGLDTKFTSDGLKKVLDKRNGTSGEINLVLVNLLQIFKIEAYPLIVAERSFGRVDPKFPFLDRFNKTVAYAVVDNEKFILDATEKYCPAELIPYSLLNTYALIISKNTKELIQINTGTNAYNSSIKVTSQLDKAGILTGKSEIKNSNYALQYYLSQLKSNENGFISKNLQEENQGIKVDKFAYNLSKEGIDTLSMSFDFSKDLDDNNAFILFNYNLFTGQNKNPFTKDFRFTDINFGYPYSINIYHELQLPPETKMDIPEDKTVSTSQGDISISRKFERSGTKISIWLNFTQKQTYYSAQKYSVLKSFYKDMLTMLNEPILIKLKK